MTRGSGSTCSLGRASVNPRHGPDLSTIRSCAVVRTAHTAATTVAKCDARVAICDTITGLLHEASTAMGYSLCTPEAMILYLEIRTRATGITRWKQR